MERLVYQNSKLLRKECIFAEADIVRYQERSPPGELLVDREATPDEVAECMEYDLSQETLGKRREFMASPLGYLSLQDALAWAGGVSTNDVLQSLIMLAIILRDRAGMRGISLGEQPMEVKTAEGGLINRLKSLIGR